MTLPEPKALKALIKLCRSQGVKTLRIGDIEFTLSDEAPLPKSKKNAVKPILERNGASDDPISETLTEEELLFWSVNTPSEDAAALEEAKGY